MGLIDTCKELFGKDDLYEVLGCNKDATEGDIKKCYYRMSLRVHPDRVAEAEKDEATKKFQALSRVYSVLSDEENRKIYDETGEVGDDGDASSNRDWYEHWRRMFPAITPKMIANFYANYVGSDDESNDLVAYYNKFDGNMEMVFEWMIHESEDDCDRLQKILEGKFADGSLKKTAKYDKTKLTKRKKATRRKRAAEEAAEAADMLTQIKKKHRMSEDASLEALLRKRAQEREQLNGSFLEALEAKYGGGGNDEDDEEEEKPRKKAKPSRKENRRTSSANTPKAKKQTGRGRRK